MRSLLWSLNPSLYGNCAHSRPGHLPAAKSYKPIGHLGNTRSLRSPLPPVDLLLDAFRNLHKGRKPKVKRATLLLLFLFPLVLLGRQNSTPPDQDGKDKTTAILFFREHHFTGSALKPSIYVDDKEVNRLSNGRWFLVKVEPGKHKLQSSAKNEPATIVEVAPGETAYVQMVILTGNWRGGGRLLAVDPKEAQKQVAKLKPLDETTASDASH